MRDFDVYAAAVLLGALAGVRSMAAPAVLGQLSRKGALADLSGTLAFVRSPLFLPASGLLALGEAAADKLPLMPNRTAAGPLLGRALTGGISGAVVCSAKKRPPLIGALMGAAAAVAAAYGAYALRRQATHNLNLPDFAVALAEDAIVGGLGVALTSRLSEPAA
jgi:uncharacterized membrane protein